MKGKYKHIFFDLDHTLWDFDRNSAEVLVGLYKDYRLSDLERFSEIDFCKRFKEINTSLWTSFNRNELSREKLRASRFEMIFEAFGVKDGQLAHLLGKEYLRRCPNMHYILPYTLEILGYLKNEKKYELHILTNGFEDVQHIKLNSARLTPFFREVITADSAGFQKPDKEIFKYAIEKVCSRNEECIMIGDSLDADILGARESNIDQIFFNPLRVSHQETITYEISCLSEIFDIL